MKAWLFQDHRQKVKLGEDKCPWSVGWIDPEGKRRSKRIGSKTQPSNIRGNSKVNWQQVLTEPTIAASGRTSAANTSRRSPVACLRIQAVHSGCTQPLRAHHETATSE